MAPTFYYMRESPPCRAVLLLAKMLDIEFELKIINIMQGEQLRPDFIKINPQHCLPTMNDEGLVLWESRAILAYLVGTYANDDTLYPKDLRVRALVDARLQFDLGTLYMRLTDYYFPIMFMGAPLDETKKSRLREAIDWFNTMLKGRTFVAADHFTIADLSLAVTVSQLEAFEFDMTTYYNVKQWFQRCREFLEPHDYEGINASEATILAELFHSKLRK